MQTYDFEIIHRAGNTITNVDGLSRIHANTSDQPTKGSDNPQEPSYNDRANNEDKNVTSSVKWIPFEFGMLQLGD